MSCGVCMKAATPQPFTGGAGKRACAALRYDGGVPGAPRLSARRRSLAMRMGAPERVGCRRDAAASPWKGPLKWDTVESGHWRDSVVSAEESSSESCLHCEMNELVRDHIEGQETVVACSCRTIRFLIVLRPMTKEPTCVIAYRSALLPT
jgi:hypothetical protein